MRAIVAVIMDAENERNEQAKEAAITLEDLVGMLSDNIFGAEAIVEECACFIYWVTRWSVSRRALISQHFLAPLCNILLNLADERAKGEVLRACEPCLPR